MKTTGHAISGIRTATDTGLALALTTLILYAAGLALPLATAAKFGEQHSGYVFSGIVRLWSEGNWHLAVLVLGCGVVAPLLLAGSLCVLLAAARMRRPRPGLRYWLYLAARLEQWSMPEVQMLGVIVAFTKLSALVPTTPGPGLWCYGLAAFFSLLAWRRFDAPGVTRTLFPAAREAAA